MTATTTSRPSPSGPWSPRSPTQALPVPSAPTANHPSIRTQGTANQSTPRISSTLSPNPTRAQRATSPNYFEYVVDPNSNPPNSNAGIHTKKNWSPSRGGEHSRPIDSPQNWPLESHPRFENFRRQSEGHAFNLNHGSLPSFSAKGINDTSNIPSTIETVADKSERRRAALSPRPHQNTSEDTKVGAYFDNKEVENLHNRPRFVKTPSESTQVDSVRTQSPANMSSLELSGLHRSQISHIDERHPRNSLPHNRIDPPSHIIQRSETLPSSISTDGPAMISPNDFVDILERHLSREILLLDLRVNPQYSQSRIHGALNLCIPTTLLKRVSFNVQRLADTFSRDDEKAKFAQWRQVKFIVVYDANSLQLKDATSSVNTLRKFTSEKFEGPALIIRGGFNAFSKKCPDHVDERSASEMNNSNLQKLSIEPPAAAPVAGGCVMPATQTAANPFFGSIRQNMDLIGGVGQIPLQRPPKLEEDGV